MSESIDALAVGNTKGKIALDFSALTNLDASGESRYIVGGRTFFEASVFGDNLNSFTFRGFFDQEGYEEPKSTMKKLKSSGWIYGIIGACVAVVVLAVVLFCCCKKNKEEQRVNKKAKTQ